VKTDDRALLFFLTVFLNSKFFFRVCTFVCSCVRACVRVCVWGMRGFASVCVCSYIRMNTFIIQEFVSEETLLDEMFTLTLTLTQATPFVLLDFLNTSSTIFAFRRDWSLCSCTTPLKRTKDCGQSLSSRSYLSWCHYCGAYMQQLLHGRCIDKYARSVLHCVAVCCSVLQCVALCSV